MQRHTLLAENLSNYIFKHQYLIKIELKDERRSIRMK